MTPQRFFVFVLLTLSLLFFSGHKIHAAGANASSQVDKISEKNSSWPSPPKPVSIDNVSRILHVAPSHPKASDKNDGGNDAPFATIQAAVDSALKLKKQNIGVKILIAPGIYRESVTIVGPGRSKDTDAPLVLEGSGKGEVIVSGSDVWSDGWKPDGSGSLVHEWPYKWGTAANPFGANYDAGNQSMHRIYCAPICRRREMIFLNGVPLRQVMDPKELKAGRFHVDEAKGVITFQPPKVEKGKTPLIEVSIRDYVFFAQGIRNLAIRNLTFRHGATSLARVKGNKRPRGLAFYLRRCEGILIEKVNVEWNGGNALNMWLCKDVILRDIRLNHNGGFSVISYSTRILMERFDNSYNNWRGDWGNFHGWAACGIKLMFCHDVKVDRYRGVGNLATALWFDLNNRRVLIENSLFTLNRRHGICLEANQGPFLIKNCVLAFNNRGILASVSRNTTVMDCVFYGNVLTQFGSGRATRKVFVNRSRRKKREEIVTEEWTWLNNLIVANDKNSLLVDIPPYHWYFSTLKSSGNLWYHPDENKCWKLGTARLSFKKWRELGGQDGDSLFAAPKLKLSKDSPIFHKPLWPIRKNDSILPKKEWKKKVDELQPKIVDD